MKKIFVMFSLFIVLLISACKLDTTVDIYVGDLSDALEDDLQTNGKLFVQMPSSDECEDKSAKIIEIISKYMNEVKNEGCDSQDMESYLKLSAKFTITAKEESDETYNVYVEDADDLGLKVSFKIDSAKFSSLNSEINSEFNQEIELAKSTMKFELNNDLRETVLLSSIGSLSINNAPHVQVEEMELKRRDKVEIRFSNIHSELLEKERITPLFYLKL